MQILAQTEYQDLYRITDGVLFVVNKFTPIEYERLQGLPDNYTKGLCDSKRYTVCGNGWCIPVIVLPRYFEFLDVVETSCSGHYCNYRLEDGFYRTFWQQSK